MRAVLRIISGLAVSSAMALAGSANALTVVPMSTGPFSLSSDPAGVIPSGTFISGTTTDDFSFTIIGTTKVLGQMQASAVSNGAPQTISFQLFQGSPGSGVLLASSGGTSTAATLDMKLTPGNYYGQVSTVGAPRELVTGGLLLTAVPEPATWTMLLLGVGALGAVARKRRLSRTW